MKKKLIPIILLASTRIFATTFFSGETGLSADITNKETKKLDPALNIEGFFAGQLAFTSSFSVRGEFSLLTGDLYDNGLYRQAPATFRINEISAQYTTSLLGFTHNLSLYKGYHEPIGTQEFLYRRLGTKVPSSILTENRLGKNGANVYDNYGFGGCYSLTAKKLPIAFGISIGKNDDTSDKISQLNADLRLATAFRYLTMDTLCGIGAPMNTQNDKGEDVVLLIETIYYHLGIDMLIGNKYSAASFFAQCGFEYLPIKSNSKSRKFEEKDLYLLIEPRFSYLGCNLHITAFNLPKEKAEKMFFIDDTLGANASFFYDRFSTQKNDFLVGINGGASFENKFYKDFTDEDFIDSMKIFAGLFAETEAMNGKLKLAAQVNMTKFKDEKPDAVKMRIGYKKEL